MRPMLKRSVLSVLLVGMSLPATMTCDVPDLIVVETDYDRSCCGWDWGWDRGWGWDNVFDFFIDIEIDD